MIFTTSGILLSLSTCDNYGRNEWWILNSQNNNTSFDKIIESLGHHPSIETFRKLHITANQKEKDLPDRYIPLCRHRKIQNLSVNNLRLAESKYDNLCICVMFVFCCVIFFSCHIVF